MRNRIKELRKRDKMSQTALAEIVNATQQSVSQWELDPKSLPIDIACKIADYFHVSLDYLLCRTDEESVSSALKVSELNKKIAKMTYKDQKLVYSIIEIFSKQR